MIECCYIAVEMTSSPEDSGYTRREITAFQLKGSVKVPGEFSLVCLSWVLQSIVHTDRTGKMRSRNPI